MKTFAELNEILKKYPHGSVNSHIHTHLCDGKPEMTVQNIAQKALEHNIELVILTPHFHKKVSDSTATLYEDSDENILIALREEIDSYHKNSDGKVRFLLSTEADILGVDGVTSLNISSAAEDALDLVTPTVNYHPLLPLKAVEVTYGKCIEEIHSSGLYDSFAQAAGGVSKVLESLYETEANAIKVSPYPAMLGHFFAAHSYAVGPYNWFGARPEHIDIMKEGSKKIIDICAQKGAFVDVAGIHPRGKSPEEKSADDAFFFEFQKWFLARCKEKNVTVASGSDAHSLNGIGEVEYYKIFN